MVLWRLRVRRLIYALACLKGRLGWLLLKGDCSNCKPSGEVNIAEIAPRISCKITNGLIAGVNLSYDDSFDVSCLSTFKCLSILQSQRIVVALEVINSLSTTHRDVRVLDNHCDGGNSLAGLLCDYPPPPLQKLSGPRGLADQNPRPSRSRIARRSC